MPVTTLNRNFMRESKKLVGNDNELCVRARLTAAEINAGITLLPAARLRRYRLVDASMIAIGGAAAGATTIDVLATLAGVSRKLVACAVAGLTQSTLLRAGAANATILADGASFTANDNFTAITIGKTGSNLTGATNIDVILEYVIDNS